MISLRNTTLPGAVATFSPTLNISWSVWLMLRTSPRRSEVVGEVGHAAAPGFRRWWRRLAQHLGVGDQEVRRREAPASFFRKNSTRWRDALVEPSVSRGVLEPARGDQVGLLPEVEVGFVAPLRVVEAIVAGSGSATGGDLRSPSIRCGVRTGEDCRCRERGAPARRRACRVAGPILGALG